MAAAGSVNRARAKRLGWTKSPPKRRIRNPQSYLETFISGCAFASIAESSRLLILLDIRLLLFSRRYLMDEAGLAEDNESPPSVPAGNRATRKKDDELLLLMAYGEVTRHIVLEDAQESLSATSYRQTIGSDNKIFPSQQYVSQELKDHSETSDLIRGPQRRTARNRQLGKRQALLTISEGNVLEPLASPSCPKEKSSPRRMLEAALLRAIANGEEPGTTVPSTSSSSGEEDLAIIAAMAHGEPPADSPGRPHLGPSGPIPARLCESRPQPGGGGGARLRGMVADAFEDGDWPRFGSPPHHHPPSPHPESGSGRTWSACAAEF